MLGRWTGAGAGFTDPFGGCGGLGAVDDAGGIDAGLLLAVTTAGFGAIGALGAGQRTPPVGHGCRAG